MLMLPFCYAEIHYRLPGLFSRLFMPEPEIIFDLPYRIEPGCEITLFLLIKDADKWPIDLQHIEVSTSPAVNADIGQRAHQSTSSVNEAQVYRIKNSSKISAKFTTLQFQLPRALFPASGHWTVWCRLFYSVKNKHRSLLQDNYRHLEKAPFTVYIAEDPLPGIKGLSWGDLHLHSNYTDDVLEFGAPLSDIAKCAEATGLKFAAITDHAYDMDDAPDNYFVYDPHQQKWKQFLREISEINESQDAVVLLPGEEASVGNNKGQNVHCLVIGGHHFYPGNGDSGENGLSNQPNLSLTELIQKSKTEQPHAIIAAAHPLDKPPLLQRLLLNRGHWRRADLLKPNLDYWQILNGKADNSFASGLETWQKLLCKGHKVGIVGGTDAHGNFNRFRQISIPFLKMVNLQRQRLGEARTGIYAEENLSGDAILSALQRKRAVVSDGPVVWFWLIDDDSTATIGDSFSANRAFFIRIEAKSSQEFGHLQQIRIVTGPPLTIHLLEIDRQYNFQERLEFPDGLPKGFIHLECYSTEGVCITNPVWIS